MLLSLMMLLLLTSFSMLLLMLFSTLSLNFSSLISNLNPSNSHSTPLPLKW